jgi:hypothetical protein
MHRGKLIIPLVAVMLAMLAVARIAPGSAAAQYPTPKGNLLCSSGVITAQTNSSFQFTATFVDIMGGPVVGHTVFFSVTGSATLSTTSATTDGNGQASTTVNVGTGGGLITVAANADQFVCRAVIQVPVEVPNIKCYITQLTQYSNQYTFSVTLTSTTTVLVGQTINFFITSTGGGASLSQLAAITDGNGTATVTVYVLPTSGSVTVTANYNGMICPANINVPPPTCQNMPNPPAYCFPPTFIQQVVPPVQVIVPPQTGNAGLAANATQSSSSGGATEAAAGFVLIAAVAGIAVLARQVHEVHDATK